MKIINIQTGGFGSLKGGYEFSPGLNIIIGENERGKTTLASALLCLLYGVKKNSGKRRQASDEERRYRPFSGGDFNLGGTVHLKSGRRLNVWRDFNSDVCRVLDIDSSRDISADFQRAPNGDVLGDKLLDLSRGQYEKLAFMRQDELNASWDFAEFSDTLSTLLSTEDGASSSVHNALAALDSALLKYPGQTGKGFIKIDTELSRLNSQLADIERELVELEGEYSRSEQAFAEVADNLLRNEQLSREIRKYEYLGMFARCGELQEQLSRSEKVARQLEEYNTQLIELNRFENLQLERLEEYSGLRQLHADRLEALQRLEKELNIEQAGLGLLGDKLRQQQGLDVVSSEELQDLELSARQLQGLQQREGSANIDAQSASTALRANGGRPEQARLLLDFLQTLEDSDREFIAAYPQVNARVKKRLLELAAQRAGINEQAQEFDRRREQARKSARNHFVFAIGMMAVAVGAFFALGMQWFMAVPALLCLCWGIYGAVKMGKSGSIEAEKLAQLRGSLLLLEQSEDELDRERGELHEKLQHLAAGFPGGLAGLDEALEQPEESLESLNSFLQINQRLYNLLSELVECRRNIEPRLREWGLWRGQGSPDAATAVNCLRQAREHIALKTQYEQKQSSVQKLQEQVEQLRGVLHEQQTQAREILQEAGINHSDYADAFMALELYRSMVEERKQYLRLRDELVPAAQAACADEESLRQLREDLRITRARLEQSRQNNPFLETLKPEKSVADYESLAAAARQKLGDDSQALSERERQMTLEEERYRAKVPALVQERENLSNALEQAERYGAAVELARGSLEKIAAELHSRWSPLLAGELNTNISGFSGNWKFSLSKDLQLGVVPSGGGAGLDSEGLWLHLSSGMRDQVYLCLRLLLAGKLDHHEPLPLVLDDPFVNADDERFMQGMQMLQEIARDHQVFVFSCHNQRHKMLVHNSDEFSAAVCEL